MDLMRHLVLTPLACILVTASTCASPSSPQATSRSEPPRCAKTFVNAITTSDATPGVWDCLSPAYQNRLEGQGDRVFAVDVPLWTRYRYLGADHNIALFDLTVNGTVEPAVYNPPVSHVIMAVYLDSAGKVDHAKAATPS